MDITLDRILSLIPKKPDGKFVHGAKKDFALSIGYDSGDIVSMWINGSSVSYLNKLYEISKKYDVSVEWLKGETDEKNPAPSRDEVNAYILAVIDELRPDELSKVLAYAQGLIAARQD